jgi:hypothetical protein
VRQVRAQLYETFDGLIDVTDITRYSGDAYAQRFLSRALAALAVRRLAKCSPAEAARFVTDGVGDQGLDAIAPLPEQGRVLLVQAKWSDKGTAGFDLDAAKALVDGLNRIDNELYEQFNQRAAELAQQARPLMTNDNAVLVVALMGTVGLAVPVREVLDNALAELNRYGAQYSVEILLAKDFYDQVHADLQPAPINLGVHLREWYQFNGPAQAFQGTVPAEDVAAWYEEHGTRLFEQNLRAPLPVTATNAEITQTLVTEPVNFWHFNNGITMIANKIVHQFESARAPHSRPVALAAEAVSIVNGAQTVRAIAQAMHEDGDAAANAVVSVKVIETGGSKDFGIRVSQAANRQNAIGPRDRVALDSVHEGIKANLRAELHKLYVIKRGEPVPPQETGCSLDELALAFACLHSNAEHCARVASSTENLWEQGPRGSYSVLFDREPSPQRAWRSVESMRVARRQVYESGQDLVGRAASVAEHGGFLATHIIARHLGVASIDDPDFDWEFEILEKIPPLVHEVLSRLLNGIDSAYGERAQIQATLQDPGRCQHLADLVLARLGDGSEVPVLASTVVERKPRRRNTVPLLVDKQMLEDGTSLEYYGAGDPERTALEPWLAQDERRRRATWVNDRSKPILWEYDKQQYSPSGLVGAMWALAEWADAPKANQGTQRWYPNGGDTSLWGLALKIHGQDEGAA